jgi:hypothetical protein
MKKTVILAVTLLTIFCFAVSSYSEEFFNRPASTAIAGVACIAVGLVLGNNFSIQLNNTSSDLDRAEKAMDDSIVYGAHIGNADNDADYQKYSILMNDSRAASQRYFESAGNHQQEAGQYQIASNTLIVAGALFVFRSLMLVGEKHDIAKNKSVSIAINYNANKPEVKVKKQF